MRLFILLTSLLLAVSVYADDSVSLIATPLVGNIDLSQTNMITFTVLNENNVPIEVRAKIINPEKQGGFAADSFQAGNTLDLSQNVVTSPQVFIIPPNASQYVRLELTNPPTQAGDYFFGVEIIPTRNMGKNSQAQQSGGLSIPIFLGQLSTVYVHKGVGRPVVNLSCALDSLHQHPVIKLSIQNKSPWLFRPTYTLSAGKTVLLQDELASPVMALSSGIRYLTLKETPATQAPLTLTWKLADGQTEKVVCANN